MKKVILLSRALLLGCVMFGNDARALNNQPLFMDEETISQLASESYSIDNASIGAIIGEAFMGTMRQDHLVYNDNDRLAVQTVASRLVAADAARSGRIVSATEKYLHNHYSIQIRVTPTGPVLLPGILLNSSSSLDNALITAMNQKFKDLNMGIAAFNDMNNNYDESTATLIFSAVTSTNATGQNVTDNDVAAAVEYCCRNDSRLNKECVNHHLSKLRNVDNQSRGNGTVNAGQTSSSLTTSVKPKASLSASSLSSSRLLGPVSASTGGTGNPIIVGVENSIAAFGFHDMRGYILLEDNVNDSIGGIIYGAIAHDQIVDVNCIHDAILHYCTRPDIGADYGTVLRYVGKQLALSSDSALKLIGENLLNGIAHSTVTQEKQQQIWEDREITNNTFLEYNETLVADQAREKEEMKQLISDIAAGLSIQPLSQNANVTSSSPYQNQSISSSTAPNIFPQNSTTSPRNSTISPPANGLSNSPNATTPPPDNAVNVSVQQNTAAVAAAKQNAFIHDTTEIISTMLKAPSQNINEIAAAVDASVHAYVAANASVGERADALRANLLCKIAKQFHDNQELVTALYAINGQKQ
ncbi:MAG: hypothetical protein LBB63_04335 [Holosporaceae bacterium]|nr:hypothetical protein [Holosporaceae bacterium]